MSWQDALHRTQFMLGSMTINSRQLCALIAAVVAVVVVIVAVCYIVVLEHLKGLAARLRHDRQRHVDAGDNQRHKPRKSIDCLKVGAVSGAYILWISGVTYVFVTHFTGPALFRDFEVILVLFATLRVYNDARTVVAADFWRAVRRQVTVLLLLDAYLSLHSYPLLWEAIALAANLLLTSAFWFLKLVTQAERLEDIGTVLGRRLYILLVICITGGVAVWAGPGLWFSLTNWSEDEAASLGWSVFLWTIYFVPLILPLLVYRWLGPDISPSAEVDHDHRADRREAQTPSLAPGEAGEPASPPTVELQIPNWDMVMSIALSPDGQVLATCDYHQGEYDYGHLRLWRVDTGLQIGDDLNRLFRDVPVVAFSRDGCQLAIGDRGASVSVLNVDHVERPTNTDIRLAAPLLESVLPGHVRTEQVLSLTYSPDNQIFAILYNGRKVALCELTANRLIGRAIRVRRPNFELTRTSLRDVACLPHRKLLVTIKSGWVQWWDLAKGRRIGRSFEGYSAVFSADGALLATGGRTDVQVWDTRTRKAVGRPFAGHTDIVGAVAFSPDGRLLASGSNDCTVRIWDPTTGRLVAGPLALYGGDNSRRGRMQSISSLTFSSDNKIIAAADYRGKVCIWSLSGLGIANTWGRDLDVTDQLLS